MKRPRRERSDLRRRAEAALRGRQPEQAEEVDARRLLHELEVHQLELGMQNEELRRARAEVEGALERYTELFDFAPIGYFAVSDDGVIRNVNFVGARLLDLERSLVTGRRFEGFLAARDAAAFARLLARAFTADTEAARSEGELSIVRPGGGERQVRITVEVIGHPVRSGLIAAEDVTARRQAEDALREESRHKDEFLATLSHELRNPLGPIRNGLYLLEHGPSLGEGGRRALAVIDRQVAHLTHIVEDLLDVTRIARGKVRLSRAPVELVELVRRTIDDHRESFEARRIALDLDEGEEPLWLEGDATRLAQVLGNLLANAEKFTPAEGRVEVVLRREGAVAVLSVRDSGVGIAPDVRARLFEPFTQAPQTLDRTPGGLGLGLAMVKGLVELHGGAVTVESQGEGRGAEFTVRLPLVAAPHQVRAAAAAHHGDPRRVLIIEDNEDGATTLRDILELRGHEVRIAGDGPGGLAVARAWRPEIVICDIGLPGMDGYHVARVLRGEAGCRGALLIALTGYARPEDARRAAEAGFDSHLGKPPSVEKLELLFEATPGPGAASPASPAGGSLPPPPPPGG